MAFVLYCWLMVSDVEGILFDAITQKIPVQISISAFPSRRSTLHSARDVKVQLGAIYS